MPEPARTLRLVGCEECERKQRMLDAMQLDMDNLEADLKAWRRRYRSLESELADKRRSDPLFATAEQIWFYWRKKCKPRARKFSDEQLKVVLARLKDRSPDDPEKPAYSPRYICEAILGAAWEPYVDAKGKVFNSLTLICRDGEKLEDFNERYQRRIGRRRVFEDNDGRAA